MLLVNIYVNTFHPFRFRNLPLSSKFTIKMNNENENEKSKQTKSTQFQRIIDDFIGKRYGAGESFYGKRMSKLTEEEYQEIKKSSSTTSKYDNKPFRENSILLVGDVYSGVGEWISYDLYEKGFNIRIATNNYKKTVDLFGLSGNNVDIIELTPDSDDLDYSIALQGTQAVIFCGNFEPKLSFFLNEARNINLISLKVSYLSIFITFFGKNYYIIIAT